MPQRDHYVLSRAVQEALSRLDVLVGVGQTLVMYFYLAVVNLLS